MSTETTTRPAETAAPKQTEFTPAEHSMLDAMNVPSDRRGRALLFREMQRTGLDPFAKHLYLREDYNKKIDRNVYTVASTIEGFRIVAKRQSTYQGQTAPQWCDKNGNWTDVWYVDAPPVAARIGVYVRDYREPMWGIARFNEYNAGFMWAKMASHMVAKVAEALAIRKAYPDQLSGIYTDDEMQQADARNDEKQTDAPGTARRAQHSNGPVNDEWNTATGQPVAPPSPAVPSVTGEQLGELARLLKQKRQAPSAQWNGILSQLLRRPIDNVQKISQAEARSVIETLTAETDAAPAGPVPVGTPDNPRHTASQMKMIQATLAEKDITDPQAKRDLIGRILGVRIEKVRHLSQEQASKVIEHFHTGEIPPPAPLVDRLAEQMRAAQSSEELADHSEWMWRAHEAGELSQAEVSKLQDISLERETQLVQAAKAAA